jgi:methionyl-tRNA formyltransferase
LQEPPVKKAALRLGLPVLQPEKLKAPDFQEELQRLKPDLGIVIAFRMLPVSVWSLPRLGTFNLHASLLPQYRGAAPINWAIINGEKETGLTTFFLKHEIDTGDILLQERIPIGPDETAGELHDRMMMLGADVVLRTVEGVAAETLHSRPQTQSGTLKHAPKIFKEDCRIDWSKPLDDVHNFIRGLSPYPGAWTTLEGKTFKILRTRKEPDANSPGDGSAIQQDTGLKVSLKGGYLHLLEVQMEGKRRMSVEEFLKGYRKEVVFG